MEFVTNYSTLLLAVLASVIVGMLWYGPLFGAAWMKSIGKTKEEFMDKSGPMKGMVISIIGAFITAWIMSHVLQAIHPAWTTMDGVTTGFFMWFGFVFPTIAAATFYDGRGKDYLMINGGFRLVEFLAIGLVLGLWL